MGGPIFLRFLILTSLSLSAMAEEFRFERPLMGTTFRIVFHAADKELANKAAEGAFALAGRLDAMASDYRAESELSRLSSAPVGSPIGISPELFDLLSHARKMAEMSEGAFDPSLGPLTKLWRESRKAGRLASKEDLLSAREACGWQFFTLDPETGTITLLRPRMVFDLGGVAKGYAADLMLESLAAAGIKQAMVAAGGDIRVGEPPPGSAGWRVALQSFDLSGTDEVLVLSNAAVSTSGDLHQSVEIGGVLYSHILEPRTGLGLTRRVAATVIASEAKLSDPLATAACVLGPGSGEAIRFYPGVKGVKILTLKEVTKPTRSSRVSPAIPR